MLSMPRNQDVLQSFSMALKGHQQLHIQVVGHTVHKKIVGAAIFKGNAEVTALGAGVPLFCTEQ